MKVIIEDVETGLYRTHKITFTKLEPENVELDEYDININTIIWKIHEKIRKAKPVMEEEKC